MTHLEIEIDRIVLDGVPHEWAVGFGPLVESAIAELGLGGAATTEPQSSPSDRGAGGPVSGRSALAALVAERVLAEARAAAPALGKGEAP